MVLDILTVIGPRYFNFQSIVDEFVVEHAGILIGKCCTSGTATFKLFR